MRTSGAGELFEDRAGLRNDGARVLLKVVQVQFGAVEQLSQDEGQFGIVA